MKEKICKKIIFRLLTLKWTKITCVTFEHASPINILEIFI